jgi:hypothetical protein
MKALRFAEDFGLQELEMRAINSDKVTKQALKKYKTKEIFKIHFFLLIFIECIIIYYIYIYRYLIFTDEIFIISKIDCFN